MRPLMIAFLILSPFIALAQSYHLHAPIPLPNAAGAHFAHDMMACASARMSNMVHSVQALLG
jgi:hypothetical protein